MSYCLVSCCNQQGGLWLVDLDQGKAIDRIMRGNVRGFCQTEDRIYAAQTVGIVEVNRRTSRIIAGHTPFQNHPKINFHHLITWREYLLLVVSGMNLVAILDKQTFDVVGRFSISEPTYDFHHLNTIVPCEGGVLLSMFTLSGKQPTSPWPENDGAIVSITDKSIENALGQHAIVNYRPHLAGLDRPHDALQIGSYWYSTELVKQRVVCWVIRGSQAMAGETAVTFDHGFCTRGLARVGNYVIVGASAARTHTHDAAFLQVFAVRDERPDFTVEVQRIPLPASEVYQIEAWEEM